MIEALELDLLTPEQYQKLQTQFSFDEKTSSWLATPDVIRQKVALCLEIVVMRRHSSITTEWTPIMRAADFVFYLNWNKPKNRFVVQTKRFFYNNRE